METLTKQRKKPAKQRFAEVDWTNKVILIADDVRINYLLLKALLGKTKAQLLWAENGEQAIEYCKSNNQIDVVLMDYNMPKMNGYSATKKIKQFRNDLPVISQTTYSIGTHEFDELSSTCDDFILKPINKNKLLSVIGKHINR